MSRMAADGQTIMAVPQVFDAKSVYVQDLVYAGPGMSYRVSKNLSIGASFGLGQSALGVNMDARAPNALVNMTKVLGDATQGMENPIFDLTVPLPLFRRRNRILRKSRQSGACCA